MIQITSKLTLLTVSVGSVVGLRLTKHHLRRMFSRNGNCKLKPSLELEIFLRIHFVANVCLKINDPTIHSFSQPIPLCLLCGSSYIWRTSQISQVKFVQVFRLCLDLKSLHPKTSYQMFGRMYGVLNKIYL